MATISMPGVRFRTGVPRLVRSTSIARAGSRAISWVESADPFWQIEIATAPLSFEERVLLDAFHDEAGSGERTVRYTPPQSISVPQAYWDSPNAAVLTNLGSVTAIAGGYTISFNSVDNGLVLRRGDLIGLATGEYRALCRIMTGATAAGNTMTVKVEPAVPGYITTGAVVRFKSPELNCRMLPDTFSMSDEAHPTASFTLVEVPR